MTRRLALLALAAFATACVHRVPMPAVAPPQMQGTTAPALTAPGRKIRFAPITIQSTPQGMALTSLNDVELFALGTAAMGRNDYLEAVTYFERLADFFPKSKHRPEAFFQAGIALEQLRDFAGAVERFTEAERAYGPQTPKGIEARFRLADAYYFLDEYDAAIQLLEDLGSDPAVSALEQAQANVKRGIVLFTEGQLDRAEALLTKTLAFIKLNLADEVGDEYLPSQAEFYIAEVYRQHFLDATLDPAKSTKEQLLNQMEYKAQMLLSAQGHYLRCIRLGHPEWATASGFRIGELYEKMYEQMMDASLPPGLDSEAADMYRDQLKSRIRVLLDKAIDAYEQTLAAAERVGATNPFIAQTRVDLNRMKNLLLQEDASSKTAPAKKAAPGPKGSS